MGIVIGRDLLRIMGVVAAVGQQHFRQLPLPDHLSAVHSSERCLELQLWMKRRCRCLGQGQKRQSSAAVQATKASVNSELLIRQVCMALSGSWLVSLVLSGVLEEHWSLLPDCPLPVLARKLLVTVVCHLEPPPCPPLLWSQARIAVCRDGLVRAQPNWRKAHSLGLDYSML